MSLTITEALAEIKTINKRIEKKREAIPPMLARQEGIKDPYEKDGGTEEYIRRERQAISDLEDRIIQLRKGIQSANDDTIISINGKQRTISEWLTWRREVAKGQQGFLNTLKRGVSDVRNKAKQGGFQVNAAESSDPRDFILHISEIELNKDIENVEYILGTLDGQLSLKNATVLIEE